MKQRLLYYRKSSSEPVTWLFPWVKLLFGPDISQIAVACRPPKGKIIPPFVNRWLSWVVQEGSVGLPPIPAPAGCLHVPDSMLLPHCCLHAADPILLSVLPPRTRSHLADDLLVFDRKSPSPAPTSMVAHTVGIDWISTLSKNINPPVSGMQTCGSTWQRWPAPIPVYVYAT